MRGVEVILSVPVFEHKDIIDGKPLEVDERYKVWKPQDGSHTCFFRNHLQLVDVARRRIVFSENLRLVRPGDEWAEYFPQEWFEGELIISDKLLLGLGIRILKTSVLSVRDLRTGKILYEKK